MLVPDVTKLCLQNYLSGVVYCDQKAGTHTDPVVPAAMGLCLKRHMLAWY